MRLQILKHGFRPLQKLIISALFGQQIPGPVAVLSYRRELFGKYLNTFFQEGMRSKTSWSKGEAELFAAFISNLQQCHF